MKYGMGRQSGDEHLPFVRWHASTGRITVSGYQPRVNLSIESAVAEKKVCLQGNGTNVCLQYKLDGEKLSTPSAIAILGDL